MHPGVRAGQRGKLAGRDARRGAGRAHRPARPRNDIRHSATWHTDGGHAIGRNMLQSDPPQHTRLRRLVAGQPLHGGTERRDRARASSTSRTTCWRRWSAGHGGPARAWQRAAAAGRR
ncbi:cytochrome P450 [Streptomyces thinghirensis]|nr:cytochrome P450 [Streptomyces thinghirensis]